MEAEVTLHQEYVLELHPVDQPRLHLRGIVYIDYFIVLRVLYYFLCRNREPQCTCSHPEPLAAAGAGGKQRQGGPGAGGGQGEPHRHRGQSVIVSGGEQR